MNTENTASDDGAERQLQEKIATWSKEYLANALRNQFIENELKKFGLTPPKTPRTPASALPDGMEEAVRKLLTGKTVTAGDFEEWLAKMHGIYKVAEQRKVRLTLKKLGVVEEKPKAKGQSTFVWLAGEEMKGDAVKP